MVDPYVFIEELSKTLTADSVVVADAGTAFHLCQALKLPEGARYLTDGAQGAMGAAIPMAIGAALAGAKDVRVVTGDGSFAFQSQNVGLIEHYRLPVVIYVVINGGYNTIRATQDNWCEGRHVGLMDDSWVSWEKECIKLIDIDPAVKTRRPRVHG